MVGAVPLNAAGVDTLRRMRKAADWLVSIQNSDGGWGEDGASYRLDHLGYESRVDSVADGVGGAWSDGRGRVGHPAVARGIV